MISIIEEHFKENRAKIVKKMEYRAGSIESAEDIVQEAYYRALKYSSSFRDGEDFSKWFSTILRNCLREYKNIENGHTQITVEDEEPDNLPRHMESHMLRDIFSLVETKSPVQKEVLYLYFKNEYSAIDISRITSYSYANCHQIIQRFRNELKELYQ